MRVFRRAAVAVLVSGVLGASVMTAAANDRTIFAGCVMSRTSTSVTLSTSGGEEIVIDTTWLKPDMLDALTAECVTVSTLNVDGRRMAESVEEGVEPNEVNSVTGETTSDRVNKAKDDDDNDKNSGSND